MANDEGLCKNEGEGICMEAGDMVTGRQSDQRAACVLNLQRDEWFLIYGGEHVQAASVE